jgi:tRNA A37 N6-isopentenylltransferase MiaA
MLENLHSSQSQKLSRIQELIFQFQAQPQSELPPQQLAERNLALMYEIRDTVLEKEKLEFTLRINNKKIKIDDLAYLE